MSEILLVRQQPLAISDAERAAVLRVVFGIVDGLGERGRRQWRRLWNGILRLEPGEILQLTTHKERCSVYHRRHMLMESRVFEAQERFDSFDAFRAWLKVGAGFVDWYPGPKGAVMPVPRSINYSKLEQGEMEQVHADMVHFLRTPHACKTLWPKAAAQQAFDNIDLVLAEFGRFGE